MLTSCEWGAYFLAISHVFVTILGRFAHTAYENSQTYQNWGSVVARGGIEPPTQGFSILALNFQPSKSFFQAQSER